MRRSRAFTHPHLAIDDDDHTHTPDQPRLMAAPSSKTPSLSSAAGTGSGASIGSRPPLIPLNVVDAPTQRLWALAATGLVQAWKLMPLLTGSASLSKILLIDFVVLLLLSKLRIPRLDFSETKWAFIGAIALVTDWLLTGGWRSVLSVVGLSFVSSWIQSAWSNSFALPLGISEHRVRINDLIRPSSHLLGQHTIHILPYSTATFSTNAPSCHCIGVGSQEVKIPIFFNNTEPTVLQYSVTPFDDSSIKTLYNVTIPKSSLITVGGADGNHDGQSGSGSSSDGHDALTWRDEVEAQVVGSPSAGALVKAPPPGRPHSNRKVPNSHRGNQQRIFHLPIQQVGRIRLERVLDKSRLDARISRSEVLIVECPTTTFISSDNDIAVDHRCPGQETQLNIQVSGLAPLQVSYRRKWQGSTPRSQPEDQLLTISHISSARIANSPLLGGSTDGSNPDEALDVVLNRRRPSSKDHSSKSAAERDFSWAIPQTEVAPISVQLDRAGMYTYEIEAVKDACGNAVSMDSIVRHHQSARSSPGLAAKKLITSSTQAASRAPQALKQVEVHPRAHANIVGCSADRPLQLLKGGPAKQITLKATGVERDAAWTALLRYAPEEQEQGVGGGNYIAPPFQRNITFGSDGLAKVEAAHPGTYTLESLNGKYCSGEVGSPWSCPVVEVPSPTADITFSSIDDVCAGPVGVKALAVLSGTPPFRLQYEIRRAGQHPIKQDRVISRTREEFEFRPSTEGAVQYRFTGLADANYRGLQLDGPLFEQTVHPLAKAQFLQPGGHHGHAANNNKLVMRSCEGSQVKADVSLEGTGPFDLTHVVRSGSGKGASEQRVVKGIDGTHHPLEIALPAHINAHGGSMTVSLVSIKDGKNCERSLATSDLNIEIRRVRPTAGFVVSGKTRGETVLLEGKEGKLPVRLEGEGPWTVEWARQGEAGMPTSTTIHQAESALVVDRPGLYSLLSVKDAFCSGSVVEGASEWMVTTRTRPSVHFDSDTGAQAAKNGSLLRPAVCRGTPDSVDLRLSGHFPVEVTYEQRSLAWIGASGSAGGVGGSGSAGNAIDGGNELGFIETDGMPSSADARERSTFSAAQESTVFQLSTEAPGWHVYELVQVGDTSYPLSNVRRAPSQRLEQMVYPLPSAVFVPAEGGGNGRRAKRASYCVGDTLASRGNNAAAAPTVQLSGTPPFSLEFELSSVGAAGAASPGVRFTRTGIRTHTAKLEVDESEAARFKFDKPGEWKFRILSLQDGNGCIASRGSLNGRSGSGGSTSSGAIIEVADTADIAPVGTRSDFCVGETVEYILSGSTPWTVEYTFNNALSTASVRSPVFSRIAEKPGVLQIKSVAHNQNKCQRHVIPTLEGMSKTIHALPSVKVTGGGNFIEDLREGGETSIIFSLAGEAPFSFTYQRLEAADLHANPKVLETHTVAGVLEEEYKVVTSAEGTWRVTWLQDRWCSVSVDGAGRWMGEGRARLAIEG